MGMAPGMVQSLFQALHARSFPEEASQPVNALNPVNAFKFNCSTEFGSLELIVCFHEVNDDTDIQHVLSLKCFEVNLDLNDFKFFNKEENKSYASYTLNCCCYDEPCGSDTFDYKTCDSDTLLNRNEDRPSIDDCGMLSLHLNDTQDTVLFSQSETDSDSDIFESVQNSGNNNSNTVVYTHSNPDPDVSGTVIYSDESFEISEISSINTNSSSDQTIQYDLISEGSIRIYYTNADNLINNRTELHANIELYCPDIIIITEIFPKNFDSTNIMGVEMKLDGYTYFQGRTSEKSRGVCIYCKELLSAQDCKLLNEHEYDESCWCEIKLESSEKLLIGGIYRSPSSTEENTLRLNDLICSAMDLHYNYTVIVGDFNFPSINWEDWTTTESNNHISFKFIECLRDNFLTQFITQPTRYRQGQTSNILDLFITDKSEIIQNVSYGSSLGASDHISFTVDLLCSLNNVESKTVKRNFYKGDYSAVRDHLSSVKWSEMISMDIQESWDLFIKHVSDCVEKFVPLKRQNPNKVKSKWLDAHCLRCVKKKSKHGIDIYIQETNGII